MSTLFTDFVSELRPGRSLEVRSFDRVLEEIRRILIRELKRRGLWTLPPRYLGVLGGSSWGDANALEELLLDCYEYVFVRRLRGLRRQAAVHRDIDGFIVLSVQHFLHDAQRQHDHLGYRVFEIARAAVERLQEAGELFVVSGEPGLRTDTVLGATGREEPSEAQPFDRRTAALWNDELMPDLVTAWRREEVVAALASKMRSLRRDGRTAFRLGDLVNTLKEDARERWMGLLFEDEELVRPVEEGQEGVSFHLIQRPRHDFEERQVYAALLRCIARGIERRRDDPRARDYLRRLFTFFRSWSAALEEGPAPDPTPSNRWLAEHLRIPRGRVRELKDDLGELATGCRQREGSTGEDLPAWRVPPPGSGTAAAGGEAKAMDLRRRREELLGRTVGRMGRETVPAGPSPVSPGDALVFPGTEAGVEWLAAAAEPDGSVVLVPLDSVPLVGSTDLELGPEKGEGEPLVARCGLATSLPAAAARGVRVRRLGEEAVATVRRKLGEVAGGRTEPTVLDLEVDADSEYRAWTERVRAAGRQLAGELPADHPAAPARERSPWRRPAPAYALAAALALVAAGLALQVYRLRGRAAAPEPILVPSRGAGEIRLGGDERGLEVRLQPAPGGRALVYLVFRDVPEYPHYRLRLLDPGSGEIRWRSPELAGEEHLLLLPVEGGGTRWRLELLGIGADGGISVLAERLLVLLPVGSDLR